MSNITNYLEAIKYLKTSPMFNLSLASKELFHSNFLQFISLLDKTTFKEIIKDLGGEVENWGNDEEWEVVREYKNLDLCVKRCDIKYDIIKQSKDEPEIAQKLIDGEILFVLENKFKSIPYKSQLDEYNKKIECHNENYRKENIKKQNGLKRWNGKKYSIGCICQPSKILLTLVDDFPDKDSILNECYPQRWKIVTYGKLCEALKNRKDDLITNYKKKCNDDVVEYQVNYIRGILDDYTNFLKEMVYLFTEYWAKCRTSESYVISNEQEHMDRKYLRIHDLFDKQRYAALCGHLIKQLNDEFNNVEFVTPNDDDMLTIGVSKDKKKKYNTREEYFKNKNIFIGAGFGYAHSVPWLEIKILHKEDTKNIIYHIQAQGDRYMHGVIVAKKNIEGLSGVQKNESTFENLVQNEIINNIIPDWMTTNGDDICGKIFDYGKSDNGKYSKYDGATANNIVIYKHRLVSGKATFQALFNQMLNDTKDVIRKLDNKFSV